MKKRIVDSDSSGGSDLDDLITELSAKEDIISLRKRLRNNNQSDVPDGDQSEVFSDDEEITYGDEDLASVLAHKFKPDPFGFRASGHEKDQIPVNPPKQRPKRNTRRANIFNDDFGEDLSVSKEEPEDFVNFNEESSRSISLSAKIVDNEDMDEDVSDSDASFVPKNFDTYQADENNSGDQKDSEGNFDIDELSADSSVRPTRRTKRPRKNYSDGNEPASKGSADVSGDLSVEISVSDNEDVPRRRSKRANQKRKREIVSEDEESEEKQDENSNDSTRRRNKKARIIEEHDSQANSEAVEFQMNDSEPVENSQPVRTSAESSVQEFSSSESLDLPSEAEESRDAEGDSDNEFYQGHPGQAKDFLELLQKIEDAVEALQSREQTKKRRVVYGLYGKALETLLNFTDQTNTMAQVFKNDFTGHSSFLQRIANTWTMFLKQVGLKLNQNQTDSILRTLTRCHKRPYLKIAVRMWKHIFTPTEIIYPLKIEELLHLCSPKAQLTLQKQVQYLWMAKRLRNNDKKYESLMLSCAMGQFYKGRYIKRRQVHTMDWENDLHQQFVTHMLTLATKPDRPINEMSLLNTAAWNVVANVSGNPEHYLTLELSEGVKQDFVSRFVLYYVILYTSQSLFGSLREKYSKLQRTIRSNFAFNEALSCIAAPTLALFQALEADNNIWLQNIVLERLLLFDFKGDLFERIKILIYRRMWDVAFSILATGSKSHKATCKFMVQNIPSLLPVSKPSRKMYIDVIEQRIRYKEKLTTIVRTALDVIGEISMSMKIYLTAIGNAYEMLQHLKILPSRADLQLLRYHLRSLDKERDWLLIMNLVEDKCKMDERRVEFESIRREKPYIETNRNWIDKIFARTEVNALNIED